MTSTDSTAVVEPAWERAQTSDRAKAYAALLGQIIHEIDAPTFGRCVEKWALFMSASDVPRIACLATLRVWRDQCPVVSLAVACATLGIDPREVLA